MCSLWLSVEKSPAERHQGGALRDFNQMMYEVGEVDTEVCRSGKAWLRGRCIAHLADNSVWTPDETLMAAIDCKITARVMLAKLTTRRAAPTS